MRKNEEKLGIVFLFVDIKIKNVKFYLALNWYSNLNNFISFIFILF